MTTLAVLRARLNDEIGVLTDAEASPWTTAQRSAAIGEGYAELWRVGVWKDAKQDLASVANQWVYALTSLRRLYRMELLDSTSRILEMPKGIIEPDFAGAGAYRLRLQNPIASGYTIRVLGWTPYKSVFANDADADDLPVEHTRIPLLKAKAILYRQQLAKFMRFGEAQALQPTMNVSLDGLIAGIAQAEREFAEAARVLSGQRPRGPQTRTL
jgi:hypothetical protein